MVKVMFVVTCLFVLGCSSDDLNPVEKCDALVEDICKRGVECFGGTQQECVQAAQRDIACGSVTGVSSSYDRCDDQINAAECSVLYPVDSTGQAHLMLPADCTSVLMR